jgi:molybdopterin molybdotransferase
MSLEEASAAVAERCRPLEAHPYPLLEAVGLVAAESLRADLDMPPFDKSAVDGVAIRHADAAAGSRLVVVEEVLAGSEPQRRIEAGQAARVMTGAPIPLGADAVVPVEQTAAREARWVELTSAIEPGRNILLRGEEIRAGDQILAGGCPLEPRHVALLAAQGHLRVMCHRRPRVAILATGNEVVPPNRLPTGAQIRNVNNLVLVSLVGSQNALGHDLGICPDEEVTLALAIRRALTSDMTLITGGVSAGVRDLVPRVLVEQGVAPVFHHVALKPGHPLWFGTYEGKPVFGLPGNPVSVFVCFELFVRPALRRLMGLATPPTQWFVGEWFGASLPAHALARAIGVSVDRVPDGRPRLCPVPSRGSSDVNALSRFEALALVPPGTAIEAGAAVEAVRLSRQALEAR